MTDNCMMIGGAKHASVESGCGNDNSDSADASTRRASVSANHSVSAQIEISTEAPNRLDVGILSKLLFHRARTNASLQLIPIVQRELIINALHETAGNYVQAAKLLGITRSTLRKRLEKFHIQQHFSVH